MKLGHGTLILDISRFFFLDGRGNVPVGKAAEHEDEFPVSKALIIFFLVVVVGSSIVQILNVFQKQPVDLSD